MFCSISVVRIFRIEHAFVSSHYPFLASCDLLLLQLAETHLVCVILCVSKKLIERKPVEVQYYYDPKSGHRFRSKNEVLQYLEYGKLEKWRSKTRGLKSKSIPTRPNTKSKTPIQTVAAKPSVQSAPGNFLSTSTPAKPPARITPKATASQRNSAHIKPTPVAGNFLNPPAANGATPSPAPLTWAPIYGPNGPIWLPWGGPVGQVKQNQVEHQESDAGAPAVSEGGAKGSQLSSPATGVQPPATGAGAPGQEIKDHQGEQENRGKLIFRLKRKQPDSGNFHQKHDHAFCILFVKVTGTFTISS